MRKRVKRVSSKKSTTPQKTVLKRIEERVLNAAIEVVRKNEGALFVIGTDVNYEHLLRQRLKPFSIFDAGAEKTLVGLAVVDGAVIIAPDGKVREYGVLIKNTRPFKGYGTRHAAAVTASKKATVILCSEEERKIKIFRSGKLVMQVDALARGIEKKTPEIASMLESDRIQTFFETIGAGVIGTVGVGVLAPAVGISLIPGVIIFGGSYLALKKFFGKK